MHIILVSFIVIVIAVQIILRRSSTGFEEKRREYVKKLDEAETNIVKEPVELPFVTPDITRLPVTDYPDTAENKKIIRRQKTALSKAKLVMIELPQNLSNIDLKLTYGSNNFDKITLYEEHFNGYHRALMEWSDELIRIGKKEDALCILQHAVDFNSNLSSVYKTLTDLYTELGDKSSAEALIDKVSASKILLKDQTIEYIRNRIS